MNLIKHHTNQKKTDVAWLPTVPEHWDTLRGRHIFRIQKRIAGKLGFDVLAVTQKGIKQKDLTPGEGQLSMDYSKYQHVFVGDFVMNHMDLLTGWVDRSPFDGVTSPDYRVFEIIDDDCDPGFYTLVCQTGYLQKLFYAYGQGVSHLGRWRFPADNFKNFVFPKPPLSEQKLISARVDRETARIDALIEKKTRFIELLKEKRQALITQAVTKGLDPNVPMRDSGVEWIGEVPEGWTYKKVAHSFRSIGSGTTPPSGVDSWYEGGTTPWVTTGELRENLVTDTSKKVTREAIKKFSALRLHPAGSLAIAMYGATIGRMGFLGVPATTNQACCVLSDGVTLDARFFFYWFQAFKETIIALHASGGGQPNINQDVISMLRVPSPDLKMQAKIAETIEQTANKVDALIEKSTDSIRLLLERRSALITAAVTGQIDLREAA